MEEPLWRRSKSSRRNKRAALNVMVTVVGSTSFRGMKYLVFSFPSVKFRHLTRNALRTWWKDGNKTVLMGSQAIDFGRIEFCKFQLWLSPSKI